MSRDIEKCLAQLKAFFEETSQEELDKIYSELEEWNDVGPTCKEFIQASSKHPYIGLYVRAGGELNGVYGYIVDVEEVFDEDFDCTKMIIHIKDENDGSIIMCDKDDVVELIPQVEYIEKGLY